MPGAGFPKSRRLLRAQEFRTVLNRSRRLRTAMFTAAVAANDLGRPRLGITVSRKVSLRATRRNQIKRMAREAFRTEQHQLPSADIVLLATKTAADTDARAVRLDLKQLFARIGIEYAGSRPGR